MAETEPQVPEVAATTEDTPVEEVSEEIPDEEAEAEAESLLSLLVHSVTDKISIPPDPSYSLNVSKYPP